MQYDVVLKLFIDWITNFNGLAWVLEIKRSRIQMLNTWNHPDLGADVERLLKDINYRQSVVHPSDRLLLEEFWDVVAQGEPTSIIFRTIDSTHNTTSYLILKGWKEHRKAEHVYGIMQELSHGFALQEQGLHSHWLLSHTNYPVIEIDTAKQTAYFSNEAAHTLFNVPYDHKTRLTDNSIDLQSILPNIKSSDPCLKFLLEAKNSRIKNDHCIGKKTFRTLQGDPFEAHIRVMIGQSNSHFRIAFMESPRKEQSTAILDVKPFLEQVDTATSLKEALELLFEAANLSKTDDGIMFSHIQANKDRVEVYGVGQCFKKLKWGMRYTYKGTIAQEIEHFMLSHVVVEDTHDSIKSIDWVLFNPYKIRSYYAKPFYNRKKLHAVLIFCSKKARNFTTDNCITTEKTLSPLYTIFEHIITLWRSGKWT